MVRQDAQLLTMRLYSTDTPCRQGHKQPLRYVVNGQCVLCNRLKTRLRPCELNTAYHRRRRAVKALKATPVRQTLDRGPVLFATMRDALLSRDNSSDNVDDVGQG